MQNKRTNITQELCDHVKILLAGGANIKKAAEITKTGHATISRIKAAGFNAETYRKNQQKQKAKKPEVVLTINHEELDGQMKMDLQDAEEPKQEMSNQTKMMRFQAGQAEKIIGQMMVNVGALLMKMDRINDTLCQILRAIRKE